MIYLTPTPDIYKMAYAIISTYLVYLCVYYCVKKKIHTAQKGIGKKGPIRVELRYEFKLIYAA